MSRKQAGASLKDTHEEKATSALFDRRKLMQTTVIAMEVKSRKDR